MTNEIRNPNDEIRKPNRERGALSDAPVAASDFVHPPQFRPSHVLIRPNIAVQIWPPRRTDRYGGRVIRISSDFVIRHSSLRFVIRTHSALPPLRNRRATHSTESVSDRSVPCSIQPPVTR